MLFIGVNYFRQTYNIFNRVEEAQAAQSKSDFISKMSIVHPVKFLKMRTSFHRASKEAIRFLYIANGSIAEVITQLYIAFEIGYIEKEQFDKLIERLGILSKQIKTLISYRTASDKP